MYNLLWMRLLILALAIVGVICWLIWGRRTMNMGWASFVFLWLANLVAFHVFRLLCHTADVIFLNNWSLAIHLQAALSLAIVGVQLVRGKR